MNKLTRRIRRKALWAIVIVVAIGILAAPANEKRNLAGIPDAVAKVPDTLGLNTIADKIRAITGTGTGTPQKSRATITRVVDGDTIEVRFPNGTEADVRLLAYDTPESKRPGVTPECGSKEAAAFTKRIAEGRPVRLTTDPTQDTVDRYGRLLRYAQVNGRDIGRRVINAGWGAPYVFNRSNPPRNITSYRAAANAARNAGRGVWTLCGGNFHSEGDTPWSGD